MSAAAPEPDPSGLVIYVGQDKSGRWLVQDSDKRIEGRFVSYAAARNFARAEGEIHHASVAVASAPLTSLVPFAPMPLAA